ncbi:Protein of unknown function [Gryllus bimaculatus]|nr:Protein of unknown function [Gryllus bimaculatus]
MYSFNKASHYKLIVLGRGGSCKGRNSSTDLPGSFPSQQCNIGSSRTTFRQDNRNAPCTKRKLTRTQFTRPTAKEQGWWK